MGGFGLPTIQQPKTVAVLTGRQREVLYHASMGLRHKEIAFRLGISHGMVKVHSFESIKRLRGLGFEVNSLVAAVALALRQGWIT